MADESTPEVPNLPFVEDTSQPFDGVPSTIRVRADYNMDPAHIGQTPMPAMIEIYRPIGIDFQEAVVCHDSDCRLFIKFGHGTVDANSFDVPGSYPMIQHNGVSLPRNVWPKNPPTSMANTNRRTFEDVAYVELIAVVDDADSAEARDIIGDRRLSTLRAIVSLWLGKRILGSLLVRRHGGVLPDGYFVNRLQTVPMYVERSITNLELGGLDISSTKLDVALNHQRDRRIELACEWFWRAEVEFDPAVRFLGHWIALELLANSLHQKVICAYVEEQIGREGESWRVLLNQLSARRKAIAHDGKRHRTAKDKAHDADLERLVEALLESELGLPTARRGLNP